MDKYKAVRFDNSCSVITGSQEEGITEICKIPSYYQNDLSIAEAIAKLLNDGKVVINPVI